MLKKNDESIVKVKKTKYKVAIILAVICIMNYGIRMSELIKVYEINFITNIIAENGVNILLLIIVLCILNYQEVKKFEDNDGRNKQ